MSTNAFTKEFTDIPFELIRQYSFQPASRCLLSLIREDQFAPYDTGHPILPFDNRIFVIGPMNVNPRVLNHESNDLSLEVDLAASHFHIKYAVASSGKVLHFLLPGVPPSELTPLQNHQITTITTRLLLKAERG